MPRRQESAGRRPLPPRIGGRLRELLDERFLTHRDLADALGVDTQTISRWTRNETGPGKRRIRQIAEYFDVPPASLIENRHRVAA